MYFVALFLVMWVVAIGGCMRGGQPTRKSVGT